MNLGENIKEIIRTEGYSQKGIAGKLKMNPKTFSAMLNGRKIIRASDIPQICRALNKTPDEIFDYVVDNYSEHRKQDRG